MGYGQSSISNGGGDYGTFTGDFTGTLSFDNGLHWGLDAKYYNTDPDNVSGDVSLWDLGATLNYQIDNGGVPGGYLDYTGLEGWIGESETSSSLPNGTDRTDLDARIRYQASDNAVFGGHYFRSDVSGGGVNLDLYYVGLGGYYRFNSGWGTYAGLVHRSFSDLDLDYTMLGIGVVLTCLRPAKFPDKCR
ncbi:hypothetical protein AB1A64_07900 [Ruegeria sp. ANG10]|uniref:hypothetical protein n=1 Tax=Ruegeria sp. ANG10 TaxID=3042467 RepID=UPI0034559203